MGTHLKNKDIARILGISATAVSLAVNGRPGVSNETRRRVLELVNERNRQSLGEALASTRANGSLLLVIHKTTGEVINNLPFFSALIETVQAEAYRLGYPITIAHHLPGQDFEEHLEYLAGLDANGMVLEATELDEPHLRRYLELDLPTVLLDGYFDLVPVSAVTLDDQTSMLRAFAYAADCGHRAIGFLAGTPRINNFIHHLDGFRKGIAEFGDKRAAHPVIELPCQIDAAYRAMAAYLARPPRGFTMPTCFIADLDNIAVGAMRALAEAGVRIPEDVSMIGYGDTVAAKVCRPQLTTTRINLYDSGRLAVQRLADLLAHPERQSATTTFVSSELIERDSVRCLAKQAGSRTRNGTPAMEISSAGGGSAD
ncbi:LacI family DNA-binding transcriptional regulator [Collinsella vaginalis]|uniref:LacI family DNA-binding transcriptional regulator n=1 Tax=Collinsella vaginalis TaxID=1870987 RepID=UPI000A267EBB|nr:LacI family DNA-binding transcriptional regulator [Collinsella vaginalis]